LRPDRWYEIRAGWSADDTTGWVSAAGRQVWPDESVAPATAGPFAPPVPGTSLRLAAGHAPDLAPIEHFNGRIDDPTLRGADRELLAAWDLSQQLDDFVAPDNGPRGCDLVLHNAPTRSVPGRRWDGSVHDPRLGPDHYSAVHFHEDDLEDAGWPADVRLDVPAELRSGIYGFRLRTSREETIVPFFVTPGDGSDAAPVAFLASTATYLAYANNRLPTQSPIFELSETFGTAAIDRTQATISQRPDLGPSLYDTHRDGHSCHVVSRRRPMIDISVAGDLWTLNADLDVVAHLERSVDRYDVITDEDLHREGLRAAGRHRCIVTGTHPEYWSTAMWDAMVQFLAAGGRLMYLGGNGFYWRVSHHPDRPWLMECRRAETGARYSEALPGEYYHQFGGELGGLWRRIGRSPQSLVGVGTAGDGWDSGSAYHYQSDAYDARAAFIVDGLDLEQPLGAHGAFGDPPGAAGAEIDRADADLGTPAHALVIASSGPHSENYVVAPEETLFLHRGNRGDVNPQLRADVVFFETPSGGAVFSTGSIAWGASLPTDDFDNDVSRMTANVLRRFAEPAPFSPPGAATR
jgi:N,N-dimethylformamidase